MCNVRQSKRLGGYFHKGYVRERVSYWCALLAYQSGLLRGLREADDVGLIFAKKRLYNIHR